MFDDFQIAEEVLAPAVDHGNPVLFKLAGVVVCEHKGTHSRVDVTRGVAHHDAKGLLTLGGTHSSGAHGLSSSRKPLSESLHCFYL